MINKLNIKKNNFESYKEKRKNELLFDDVEIKNYLFFLFRSIFDIKAIAVKFNKSKEVCIFYIGENEFKYKNKINFENFIKIMIFMKFNKNLSVEIADLKQTAANNSIKNNIVFDWIQDIIENDVRIITPSFFKNKRVKLNKLLSSSKYIKYKTIGKKWSKCILIEKK